MRTFNWTYKIGDNIRYNLDLLFYLIDDHNKANDVTGYLLGENEKSIDKSYTKPIAVISVSVIEAVLVDFLERLDQATNEFPKALEQKRSSIKNTSIAPRSQRKVNLWEKNITINV